MHDVSLLIYQLQQMVMVTLQHVYIHHDQIIVMTLIFHLLLLISSLLDLLGKRAQRRHRPVSVRVNIGFGQAKPI